MNKISTEIGNHKFINKLSGDLKPIIGKIEDSKGSSRGQMAPSSYVLTDLDLYTKTVFLWAVKIIDCFQILEQAKFYISHFRNNKQYKQAGIGRSQHINYHYFSYAIAVVTIMDVSLILTDKTFRLGNPERLCNVDSIIKNSWVCSKGIDKPLKALNSAVKPWRDPRNLYVHRGQKLSGDTMHILEAYDLLRDESITKNSFSIFHTNYLYSSQLSKLNKKFEQTETNLLGIVNEFLSQLMPIYDCWCNRLKQTANS